MSISSTISAILQLTGLTQAAAALVAFARKVKQAALAVASAAAPAGRALKKAFGVATKLAIATTAAAIKRVGEGSGLSVRESLRLIENGQRRRTINGKLVHTGRPEFHLYELTISSDDVQPPALSRLWAGVVVTVVPVSELADVIGHQGSTATLLRDPQPGSVRARDSRGLPVALSVSGRVVALNAPADGMVRIHYRPVLTLMVTEPWSQDESETGGNAASTSWSISLAEVRA